MKRITSLLIPKPFNFRTAKRRALLLCYLAIKFRYIVGFYKKLPNNDYIHRYKASSESVYKCFGNYLSIQFSIKEKIDIVKHHHLLMCTKFTDHFLDSMAHKGICLWHKTTGSGQHVIMLSSSLNNRLFLEGELVLEYRFNNSLVYRMIFTVVPAQVVDKPSGDYIFIGSSQGAINSRERFKLCEKENHRIRPDSMLIITLQAFAAKNGISNIIGICAENQVSLTYISNYSAFLFSYEELWLRCGAEIQQGHYVLPIIPYVKDKSIRNNYRSQDRKRQLMRTEIYETIKNNFDQYLS